MRWVLDTNVVASALLWGGEPSLLLRATRNEDFRLFTSTPLLAELTDILGRAKFQKKITASLLSVDQLVDRYAELASVVIPLAVPRVAPDPDDDVVIGTALAAKADFVVTGDRSLRSVRIYNRARIISVSEALLTIGRS